MFDLDLQSELLVLKNLALGEFTVCFVKVDRVRTEQSELAVLTKLGKIMGF